MKSRQVLRVSAFVVFVIGMIWLSVSDGIGWVSLIFTGSVMGLWLFLHRKKGFKEGFRDFWKQILG